MKANVLACKPEIEEYNLWQNGFHHMHAAMVRFTEKEKEIMKYVYLSNWPIQRISATPISGD